VDDTWSMTWDAEGRMVTAAASGGSTTSFEYDGEGRRVRKTTGSVVSRFVYDAFGGLALEDGGVASFTSTEYLHTDHLGSTRLATDGAGEATRRYDYRPFGGELTVTDASWRTSVLKYGANSDLRVKFTGKERDGETWLDWFGTRYLSSAQGRFTSPDKPFADQTPFDPQSWNLYSYTRNNSLKYVDRTGEAIETAWDVLNIGLGVKSFVDNVRSGNYGSAALAAVGVVVDSAAAAVPFIPGGAGAVIKAGRMAENAADVVGALNRSDNVVDAVRATDTAADANKLVPDPYGKKGGPAHQAKVDDVVANT
jgi:RHS repeat-associated protein